VGQEPVNVRQLSFSRLSHLSAHFWPARPTVIRRTVKTGTEMGTSQVECLCGGHTRVRQRLTLDPCPLAGVKLYC